MDRVLWRNSNPCTDSLSLDPAHDSIAPLGPNEQRPGTGEGSSTGVMLFQFIPINQNDRFVDSYRQALAQRGGTRLVDVTITERWFWAWVLNGYIFHVKGTGVTDKK